MTLVYVDPVEAYAWLCVCVCIYISKYIFVCIYSASVCCLYVYVFTYVGIFECRPVCMFVGVWCFILRRYFSILCSVHDRVTGEW
jgi:hypothetical protein